MDSLLCCVHWLRAGVGDVHTAADRCGVLHQFLQMYPQYQGTFHCFVVCVVFSLMFTPSFVGRELWVTIVWQSVPPLSLSRFFAPPTPHTLPLLLLADATECWCLPAGHYVPNLALAITQANASGEQPLINPNAWTDATQRQLPVQCSHMLSAQTKPELLWKPIVTTFEAL